MKKLHAPTAIPAPYSAGVSPSFKQRPVDLLDVDAAILTASVVAISSSLRAATAGSANGLGATYFMRQPCLPVRAARHDLQCVTGHCNERADRYLIVTCIVITDVPEAFCPLPVAVMAKASLPLYLAFAVYW